METRLRAAVLQLARSPTLSNESISIRNSQGVEASLVLRRRPPGESLARFLRRLNLDQFRQIEVNKRASIRALFSKSRKRKPFFSNALWLTKIAQRGRSTPRRRRLLLVTVIEGKAVGLCAYGFSAHQRQNTVTLNVHIDWLYIAKAWRGFGVFQHIRKQVAVEAHEHINALRHKLEAEAGRWVVVPSVVGQGESYSGLQYARRQARSIGAERKGRIAKRFRHSRLERATSKNFLF